MARTTNHKSHQMDFALKSQCVRFLGNVNMMTLPMCCHGQHIVTRLVYQTHMQHGMHGNEVNNSFRYTVLRNDPSASVQCAVAVGTWFGGQGRDVCDVQSKDVCWTTYAVFYH